MIREKTITLIIRILEECLEEEYTVEELRSKIRDILKLFGAYPITDTQLDHISVGQCDGFHL